MAGTLLSLTIDMNSMYLLDTNICIALMKLNKAVLSRFETHRSVCAIPIIVVSELYKGVYCSQSVKSNLAALELFLPPLPVINLDVDAAEDFGRIQAELKMIGRPTGAMDALIAAIARSHSATLVTHNTKDFENIPELKLEDWLLWVRAVYILRNSARRSLNLRFELDEVRKTNKDVRNRLKIWRIKVLKRASSLMPNPVGQRLCLDNQDK